MNLTGVSAGSHSYTAKYIPTDGSAFVASVSAAETVTVGEDDPSAAGTELTLTGSSSAANVVALSASIAPSDAVGSVSFYEDDEQVGESVALSGGSASISLSDVSAGDHVYTAEFTPEDESDFEASTSNEVTVTVADPVVVVPPGKSQPCIDAEAALPIAETGVTTATAAASAATAGVVAATSKVATATKAASKATKAATKAAKKVAKAKKAVKKAKSKKAKAKAKKAYSKAKKANTKAKKANAKAKAQVKTAKARLATATSSSTVANATWPQPRRQWPQPRTQ